MKNMLRLGALLPAGFLLSFCFYLVGCGGGGGGSSLTIPPPDVLPEPEPDPPVVNLDAPPLIGDVTVITCEDLAVVTWETDVATLTQLSYGKTQEFELGGFGGSTLTTRHSVLLDTLDPETLYRLGVFAEKNGLESRIDDVVFQTQRVPGEVTPLSLLSDDFNSPNLNRQFWTFLNPLNDSDFRIEGAGTGQSQLILSLPDTATHEAWTGIKSIPRIARSVDDVDFEYEVKFDSILSERYQGQGLIFESDADNYIRFDFYHDGTNLHCFAGSIVAGSASAKIDVIVPGNSPLYLRVNRTGDAWRESYSFDGVSWVEAGMFTRAMVTREMAVFGLNAKASGYRPSIDVIVDYVFETSDPISPEDGTLVEGVLPPYIHNNIDSVGTKAALFKWSTDERSWGLVRYGLTDSYELGFSADPTIGYRHTAVLDGLVPDQTYHVQVIADDGAGHISLSEDFQIRTRMADPGNAPSIEVWYGLQQHFGRIGKPQTWINILGDVSDPNGMESLTYRLNGGASGQISMGPDGVRLQDTGDFNIEIDPDSLRNGSNAVEIIAIDNQGNVNIEIVVVDYTPGQVWPETFGITWKDVSNIQDVAQPIDGEWRIEGNGVVPVTPGYDRLLGLGDVTWDDYEVTVPVTIKNALTDDPDANGPAVGVILRWVGHVEWGNQQPRIGWWPLGGIGLYRFTETGGEQIQIYGNEGTVLDRKVKTLELNVPYIFKVRVETLSGIGGRYRCKIWKQGLAEPDAWDVTGQETVGDPQLGGISLLAHYCECKFGNISVRPLN